MKIYFMKQKALDSLQAEVADNLNKYQSSSFWMDEHFINQNMPKYYFDTGIEVADYQLISGGPETDFQNAKIVFEAFKNKLNPVQASDLRLWAYLAHVQHWEYMSHRWKIDIPDEEDDEGSEERKKSPREKMIDRVKTRYFFGDSRGKAFVRQGIARLYWSAYLSSITERSYARNKILTLATLKELKKHPELSRQDIRLFLAKLNQSGAITVLDFLNPEQAGQLCEKLMAEVIQIPYW